MVRQPCPGTRAAVFHFLGASRPWVAKRLGEPPRWKMEPHVEGNHGTAADNKATPGHLSVATATLRPGSSFQMTVVTRVSPNLASRIANPQTREEQLTPCRVTPLYFGVFR